MHTLSPKSRILLAFVVAIGAFLAVLITFTPPAQRLLADAPAKVAPLTSDASPLADLDITQTGPERVIAGQPTSYTITVVNNGASAIADVQIIDTWNTAITGEDLADFMDDGVLMMFDGDYTANPPGAISSFTHTIAAESGEATWSLDELGAGQSIEIVLTGTVPITLQPTLDNYEPVGSIKKEWGPNNLGNSVVVQVGVDEYKSDPPSLSAPVVAPLLEITVSEFGETVGEQGSRVGRLVTYTLHVRNVRSDERQDVWPAENFSVKTLLPLQIQDSFIEAISSQPPGVSYAYSNTLGELTWTFEPTFVLTRGASTYLTYTARVPADTPYNPKAKKLELDKHVSVLAEADLMPFRLASIERNYDARIWSPFEKTVQTSNPPSGANDTFPNRVVTYTLTFFNPVNDTAVTTLADPLFETFVFSEVVAGSPSLMSPIASGNYITWQNITLAPYDIVSTTFLVTVTSETPVKQGGPKCGKITYPNGAQAVSSAFPVVDNIYIGHDDNELVDLDVLPQLELTKDVTPDEQRPGGTVEYIVKIENLGDTDIPGPIVITDTLPISFTFLGMTSLAPPGDPITDNGQLVWNDVPGIPAGEVVFFTFEAVVDGFQGDKPKNLVDMDASDSPFCHIEDAKVEILSPFIGTKTVHPFTWKYYPLVLGDQVTYTASIENLSPGTVYTVTHFVDVLDDLGYSTKNQTGLIDPLTGKRVYTYVLPSPVRLNLRGGTWSHDFVAELQGYGTTLANDGNEWCDDHMENSFPTEIEQDEGAYMFYGDYNEDGTPEWGAANAEESQSVYVLPHISLFQQVYPNPVAIGEVVTVVLSLVDNRPDPTGDVTGIGLSWEFPSGFTVLDSNPEVTTDSPVSVTWEGLTLPGGGVTRITLHARATNTTGKYEVDARVFALSDPSLCIPIATEFTESKTYGAPEGAPSNWSIPDLADRKVTRLEVTEGIVLNKEVDIEQIGPYGIVEYEILVENTTGAPLSSVVVTDILPTLNNGGTFPWSFVENLAPVAPISTDPPVWEINLIQPEDTVELAFTARANTWLGLAQNQITGTAPINVAYDKDYPEDAEVTVIGGVGVFKEVTPEEIQAGDVVTYTIILLNAASYDIQGVVITDTLPSGFSFEETISPPGLEFTHTDGVLTWQVSGDVDAGSGLEIVFRARTKTASEGMFTGVYYNEVEAYAVRADTENEVLIAPTGPVAAVRVTGLPTVDMEKTVSPQEILAGGKVTYTISLYNQSTSARTLNLTDVLPMGFTLAGSATPEQTDTVFNDDGKQLIHWEDLSIAGQGWLTLTFQALVSSQTVEGWHPNRLQLQIEPYTPFDISSALAPVRVFHPAPTNAQITKQADRYVVKRDGALYYTIYYTNASPSVDFQQVEITDTISPYTDVAYLDLGLNWEELGDGIIKFSDYDLGAGEGRSVTFGVFVKESMPQDTKQLVNQVEMAYTTDEVVEETSPNDNVDEVKTLVSSGEPMLMLKEVDPSQLLYSGDEVTYTITLFNDDLISHTIQVSDTLPPDFTWSAPISPTEPPALSDNDRRMTWDPLILEGKAAEGDPPMMVRIMFRATVGEIVETKTEDENPEEVCNVAEARLLSGTQDPAFSDACVREVRPMPLIDAQVSKENGFDEVSSNANLVYTIQYTNVNESGIAWESMVLTETLSPAEVIESVATSAGVVLTELSNGQYRIDIEGPVEANIPGSVDFHVKLGTIPADVTTLNNTVEIDYSTQLATQELNPDNNIAVDNDGVRHSPEEVVAKKSATPASVDAGGYITYTIDLSSEDGVDHSLRVTDTLPVNLSYDGVVDIWPPEDDIQVDNSGTRQKVVFIFDRYRQSQQIKFRVKVDPHALGGEICNTVQVQRDAVVQNEVSGLACIDINAMQTVDAYVAKDDGENWVYPGDIVTYTIEYANDANSAVALSSVILTETISPASAIAEVLSTNWTEAGGLYVYESSASLAPGQSRTVAFIVRLSDTIDAGTLLENRVDMGYTTSEPTAEAEPLNNYDEDYNTVIPVDTGDVWVMKTASPSTVRAGGEVNYTIAYYNASDITHRLHITDTLPISFTLSQGTLQFASVNGEGREVWHWSFEVAPQGQGQIQFATQVDILATGTSNACNTLQVQSDQGTVPQPSDACVTVIGLPTVDLQVSKDDGTTQVRPGDTLTYTITYTNNSSVDLTTVILTETLMPNSYVVVLSPNWTDLNNGSYRRTLGAVLGEETNQVLFSVKVMDTIPETIKAITNTVEIGYIGQLVLEDDMTKNSMTDIDQLVFGGGGKGIYLPLVLRNSP